MLAYVCCSFSLCFCFLSRVSQPVRDVQLVREQRQKQDNREKKRLEKLAKKFRSKSYVAASLRLTPVSRRPVVCFTCRFFFFCAAHQLTEHKQYTCSRPTPRQASCRLHIFTLSFDRLPRLTLCPL